MSDPPRESGDEELEELSDDVILAQETGLHAPQPRTVVATDHPSVVISEPSSPPQPRPTVRTRRGANEKTVVIRDRRKLEEMRQAIAERRPPPKARGLERRTLYLLAGAAVGSIVVGTLIAVLVDSTKEELRPATSASSAPPPVSASAMPKPIDTIDLDSLPLDKSRRRVTH